MEDMYLYIALGAFILGIIIGWQINKQKMQDIQEHIIDLAMNIEDFISEVRTLRADYKTNCCNNPNCKCKDDKDVDEDIETEFEDNREGVYYE